MKRKIIALIIYSFAFRHLGSVFNGVKQYTLVYLLWFIKYEESLAIAAHKSSAGSNILLHPDQ